MQGAKNFLKKFIRTSNLILEHFFKKRNENFKKFCG
jgi:hypothetical protein